MLKFTSPDPKISPHTSINRGAVAHSQHSKNTQITHVAIFGNFCCHTLVFCLTSHTHFNLFDP